MFTWCFFPNKNLEHKSYLNILELNVTYFQSYPVAQWLEPVFAGNYLNLSLPFGLPKLLGWHKKLWGQKRPSCMLGTIEMNLPYMIIDAKNILVSICFLIEDFVISSLALFIAS